MEIATIITFGKELEAYAAGAKLLEKACAQKQLPDLAWLEHEAPKALGELVLLCKDLLIVKVKKDLQAEEIARVEEIFLVASTVLAQRALEGK